MTAEHFTDDTEEEFPTFGESLRGVIDGTIAGWYVMDFSECENPEDMPDIDFTFDYIEPGESVGAWIDHNDPDISYRRMTEEEAQDLLDDLSSDEEGLEELSERGMSQLDKD